jgi:hypothetical protein
MAKRESLLVFDWLHSVGQNHLYVMMLILQGYFIQSLHFNYELQEDSLQDAKQYSSVPLHLSGRCGIPFGRSSVKASFV